MALLRFGNKTPQSYENIVEQEFPPTRTEYRRAFLESNGTLNFDQAPDVGTVVKYNAETDDHATFSYTFTETTRIMGIPKAVVYMACSDHNDMDVYVTIEKLDQDGNQMKNLNIPWDKIPISSFDEFTPAQETKVVVYKGPMGVLRASHRAIDQLRSIHPNWPFHPHEHEEKIEPGTVVRLEIGIWGMGIEYEPGETIRVVVSGRSRSVSHFGTDKHVKNVGWHQVHVGGDYASHIILPFV